MEDRARLVALACQMTEEYNELEKQRPAAAPDITEEKYIEATRIIASQGKILRWLEENRVLCKMEVYKVPYKTWMFIHFETLAKEGQLGGLIF